ncbi:MAG: DUF839 domain-containing protein [Halothiobacillaceae bacterium]|jgi:secreted PhoX family phosphatase|nr:DUF839 domain-containing protein [Halothiobacillaceae bacterium]
MNAVSFKTPLRLSAVAVAVGLALAGCNSDDTPAGSKTFKSIEFTHMPAPSKAEDMAKSYTTSKAVVTYTDGSKAEFPLSYNVLFKNTDKVGGNPNAAAQLYDYKGGVLKDPFGKPVIAETPDANSLLKVDNKLFLVTHYEYDWVLSDGSEAYKVAGWYSRMPMSMTLSELAQDSKSGKLSVAKQRPIDFASVSGLWIPCFGSQTPWNTHLGSEEDYDLYFISEDGKGYDTTAAGLKAMTEVYFKNEKQANPYHYGYLPEVTVKGDGSTSVVKHYSMGRGTWEMAKIMPDGKTAYYGDDGGNVGMFMYVADKAGDLTAGTLYAARWHQVSAENGGTANLSWYKLGHSTDAEVKAKIDSGITFYDIFEVSTDPTSVAQGFKAVRAGQKVTEYLKLKPGMEKWAGVLEPRRYAAYLGATTEWNKMEGVAVNSKDNRLYIAMSYVDGGFLKDETGPADHIQVAKVNAGATYSVDMAAGQKDHTGAAINSNHVGVKMYVESALMGKDISADALGNIADPERVANTDNVFFSDKMRTLFIGEDSGTHVNNFVWAYNVDTKKLSRILSVTSGGESTGLQVVDNMNGHAYIMSNSQHHGEYIKTINAGVKSELSKKINIFEANVGYIGGIPGL